MFLGKLLERKWENALTIDKGSWGYSRLSTINNYLTTQQVIDTLVQTVAFGGMFVFLFPNIELTENIK